MWRVHRRDPAVPGQAPGALRFLAQGLEQVSDVRGAEAGPLPEHPGGSAGDGQLDGWSALYSEAADERAPAGADSAASRAQAYGEPVIGPAHAPLAWLERVLESSRLRRMMVRPRGIMHLIRAS